MLHGQNLFGKRLDSGLAVANGEQNGNTDTNDGKDVTGRVAVRPFADREGGVLERLQVGVSAGIGNQAEPVTPNPLRTPAGVPFFTYNRGVVANGVRSRWGPEVAYFVGGVGFSAQYFHMDQRLGTGAAGPTPVVPFTGYYVQATWLVTGEQRTAYSQAIAPLRPFDPVGTDGHGCGAWEAVGRVSRLTVGGVVFAPGAARLADPAAVSSGATEMTLGFNWYLNRWARVQFNWEHAWFDQPVRLAPAPAPLLSSQDTVQSRLQFVF